MENTTDIIDNTVEEVEGNPVVALIVVGTITAFAAVGVYQVGTKIGNVVGHFVAERRMKKMVETLNSTPAALED